MPDLAGAGAGSDVRVIDAPDGGGSPAPDDKRHEPDDPGELRRKLTTVTEEKARVEGLFGELMKLPNWPELEAYLTTGTPPGKTPAAEDNAALDAVLAKITDDPEAKAGLTELFQLALQANGRQIEGAVAPVAGAVRLSRVEKAEQEGYLDGGLELSQVNTQEFRQFAKEYERDPDNAWIKSVKRDDPKQAAKLVAKAYKSKMDPATLAAAQDRVQRAKDDSLERSGGGAGPAGAASIPAGAVSIDRTRMTLSEIYEAKRNKKPIVISG